MSHQAIYEGLCLLQVLIGLVILLAGLVLSAISVDDESHRGIRWGLIGLVCWGAWFALLPLSGRGHDSLPALAMAALVAYVLVRHWPQLNAILSGALWWPPNAKKVSDNDSDREVHP